MPRIALSESFRQYRDYSQQHSFDKQNSDPDELAGKFESSEIFNLEILKVSQS